MWWGRVLFTVWLRNDVRAPRLHAVVRGTPVSGYRQSIKYKEKYPQNWYF